MRQKISFLVKFWPFLKVGLSPYKKNCVICLSENSLKMMKNGFCFIKFFLFSRYLSFCQDFSSCRKNGLIRQIRLTSKFMTSRPGLQTNAIHILSNISQSKGSQTMKFGQSIKYNKRNTFLRIVCTKWGKETSSRPLFIFFLNLTWGDSKWPAS